MQINIISCVFILDSEKNTNIRKNDIKKLKVLTNINNELPTINYEGKDLKKQVKKNISSILGTNTFHLAQVYTMDYTDSIDIIYLAVTNIDNIKLKKDYKLVDYSINNNDTMIFDNKEYKYETIEIEENNNIEYIHEIKTSNKELKRKLLSLLISYKRIRSRIDNTDIVFKFMGDIFTLEDVRMVYELIKDTTVDKSNFRKKIIKYCEKTDNITDSKAGYRPSQMYKFKPLKGDKWV